MTKRAVPGKRILTPYKRGDLHLHVIGAGKGESIVMHLPDDTWGVVDCYAHRWDDEDTNPTLQFLREQNVQSLAFVCLTHPHADHFRGIDQLFAAYQVGFFWRYCSQSYDELVWKYLQVQAEEGAPPVKEKLAADVESFRNMMQHVGMMPEDRVLFCGRSVKLYPYPEKPHDAGKATEFCIESIAPHDEYRLRGLKDVARFIDDSQKLKSRKMRPRVNPNDMSAALLVKYGATRIVLGGDVEEDHWKSILSSIDPPESKLACHAVKVSHHGSGNANPEVLWKALCHGTKPVAVITRFPKLPKKETVVMIKKHAAPVLCTCVKGLKFSGAPPLPKPMRFGKLYDDLLAKALTEWSVVPHSLQGTWSFKFDNNSNCLQISGDGEAGTL